MTAEQKTRSVFQCCSSKFDVPKGLPKKASRSALERCSSNSDVPKWLNEEKVTKLFGVLLLKLRCLDMPVKTNVTKCVGWLFWQRRFPKWLSKESNATKLVGVIFCQHVDARNDCQKSVIKRIRVSAPLQPTGKRKKKVEQTVTQTTTTHCLDISRTIQRNSPDTKRENKTRHQLCRQ